MIDEPLLREALGERFERDRPIGPLTTYRVGGPARWFVTVRSVDELQAVARARAGVPVLVVGRGSNLLVRDAGFDGLVVQLGEQFGQVEVLGDGRSVRAGGATSLPVVARRTVAAGLTGFEWAVGVPGSIGGAVRMNAGGHGADMAAALVGVRLVDLGTGEDVTVPTAELDLAYRSSAVREDQVVVHADLLLAPGDTAAGEAQLSEIVRWRREHQPGGQNAGSVFTNPPDDSAGRLIDAAGCRGLRVGTAEVSTKHANFIQADADGSADDVYSLMVEVARRVQGSAGVALHPETRLVGFPPFDDTAFDDTAFDDTAGGEPDVTDTIVRPQPTSDGERPQEDPRLASRRHQVQTAARRRRTLVLMVVGVVVALVAGAVLITRSALLDVDRVAVVGASTVPTARIIDASGVSTGDPLIDVDAASARRRIMALPGVASARVAVEWPDTVRIRVTEDRALARVVLPDGSYEVAWGGRVVGPAAGDDPGLPTLTTTAVASSALRAGRDVPQVLADALVVFEQMPTSLQAPMAQATLAADGSLSFAVAGIGGTVQFGPPEEVPAKLLAAASMLDGRVVTACLDTLDIREPTRPTISRKAGCALAPPTIGATTTTAPRTTSKATSKTTSKTTQTTVKGTSGTTGRTTVPSGRSTPTTTPGATAKAATTTTVARGR